jgi:hypothetical protein
VLAVAGSLLTGSARPGEPVAGPAPSTPEAVRILQLAAAEVTTAPTPAARPDQFVYVESVDAYLEFVDVPPGPVRNLPRVVDGTLAPRRTETWHSVDGTRGTTEQYRPWGAAGPVRHPDGIPPCPDGREVPGPSHPGRTVPCTPKPAVQPDLPTDPGAMLRYLHRTGSDGAVAAVPADLPPEIRAFVRAQDVLVASLTAPAVQAAVFRALARVPGVTVARAVPDAAGRRGVAVTLSGGGIGTQLIFDPATSRYLGSNTVAADPATAFGEITVRGLKVGDVLSQTAILRVAVVDRAGELP